MRKVLFEPVEVIVSAFNQLTIQLVGVLPKLILALIIWYTGKYLLGLAVKLLQKVDIKKTKFDDKIIASLSRLIHVVGRVLLVLIILDYLGIGRSVVAAIAEGVAFAIAIALGLAFGKALEGDAKEVVNTLKKLWHK